MERQRSPGSGETGDALPTPPQYRSPTKIHHKSTNFHHKSKPATTNHQSFHPFSKDHQPQAKKKASSQVCAWGQKDRNARSRLLYRESGLNGGQGGPCRIDSSPSAEDPNQLHPDCGKIPHPKYRSRAIPSLEEVDGARAGKGSKLPRFGMSRRHWDSSTARASGEIEVRRYRGQEAAEAQDVVAVTRQPLLHAKDPRPISYADVVRAGSTGPGLPMATRSVVADSSLAANRQRQVLFNNYPDVAYFLRDSAPAILWRPISPCPATFVDLTKSDLGCGTPASCLKSKENSAPVLPSLLQTDTTAFPLTAHLRRQTECQSFHVYQAQNDSLQQPWLLEKEKLWRRREKKIMYSRPPTNSIFYQSFRDRTRGRCFNCLARDHRVAQCRNPPRCWTCGGSGHISTVCRRKFTGEEKGRDRGRSSTIGALHRVSHETDGRGKDRAWASESSHNGCWFGGKDKDCSLEHVSGSDCYRGESSRRRNNRKRSVSPSPLRFNEAPNERRCLRLLRSSKSFEEPFWKPKIKEPHIPHIDDLSYHAPVIVDLGATPMQVQKAEFRMMDSDAIEIIPHEFGDTIEQLSQGQNFESEIAHTSSSSEVIVIPLANSCKVSVTSPNKDSHTSRVTCLQEFLLQQLQSNTPSSQQGGRNAGDETYDLNGMPRLSTQVQGEPHVEATTLSELHTIQEPVAASVQPVMLNQDANSTVIAENSVGKVIKEVVLDLTNHLGTEVSTLRPEKDVPGMSIKQSKHGATLPAPSFVLQIPVIKNNFHTKTMKAERLQKKRLHLKTKARKIKPIIKVVWEMMTKYGGTIQAVQEQVEKQLLGKDAKKTITNLSEVAEKNKKNKKSTSTTKKKSATPSKKNEVRNKPKKQDKSRSAQQLTRFQKLSLKLVREMIARRCSQTMLWVLAQVAQNKKRKKEVPRLGSSKVGKCKKDNELAHEVKA